MRMKCLGSDVIGSLFWLAVGIFFGVGGILLKPGTPRNPGPGFLPLIMALLLVCFSLVAFARGLGGAGGVLKKIQVKNQTIVVASVFGYGVLLDFAGFLLSTFALMCALFGLLIEGNAKWSRVLLYSAGTALIGWLVFSVALKVPFPQGQLMTVLR
jgi:putative tricarboxylic transport membrane protein